MCSRRRPAFAISYRNTPGSFVPVRQRGCSLITNVLRYISSPRRPRSNWRRRAFLGTFASFESAEVGIAGSPQSAQSLTSSEVQDSLLCQSMPLLSSGCGGLTPSRVPLQREGGRVRCTASERSPFFSSVVCYCARCHVALATCIRSHATIAEL